MIRGILDYALIAAGAALGIGLCVVFYEGVPLGPIRDIPYLGKGVSFLLDGRVDRVAAEAVSIKVKELDDATLHAQNELGNSAEARRMALIRCRNTGGVFAFDTGQCKRPVAGQDG